MTYEDKLTKIIGKEYIKKNIYIGLGDGFMEIKTTSFSTSTASMFENL